MKVEYVHIAVFEKILKEILERVQIAREADGIVTFGHLTNLKGYIEGMLDIFTHFDMKNLPPN